MRTGANVSVCNKALGAIVALGLVSALGCSKPDSSPAGETAKPVPSSSEPAAADADAAPTAPVVDTATAETQTMRLVPSSLSKTAVEGVGKHCLDCSVRKATYTYCHFDIAQLTDVVGAEKLDDEVLLNVSMTLMTSENYTPKDPNSPQPEGGFTHKMFRCSALSVAVEQ